MKRSVYNLSLIIFFTLICLFPCKLISQDAKEIPGLKKLTLTIKNYDFEKHTLLSDTLIIKEFNKNAQLTYYLKLENKDTLYLEKTIFNDKGKPLSKFVKELKKDFFVGFRTGSIERLVRSYTYIYNYDAKGNEVKLISDYLDVADDTVWQNKSGQNIHNTVYQYNNNDSILSVLTTMPDSKDTLYYELNKYGAFGKVYRKIDDNITYFVDDSVIYNWSYDKTGNKTGLTTLKYYSQKKEQITETYLYNNNKELVKITKTKDTEPDEKKVIYLNNTKTDSTVTYKNSERISCILDPRLVNDTLPRLSFYNDFRDDYFYRKLTLDAEKRISMAYLDFDGFPRLGFFQYKDKSIYPSKIERFSKNLYEIKKSRKFPDYVMEYQYEFY